MLNENSIYEELIKVSRDIEVIFYENFNDILIINCSQFDKEKILLKVKDMFFLNDDKNEFNTLKVFEDTEEVLIKLTID